MFLVSFQSTQSDKQKSCSHGIKECYIKKVFNEVLQARLTQISNTYHHKMNYCSKSPWIASENKLLSLAVFVDH